MAEPLVFDVEFNAAQSAAEAEQAIQAIDDRVSALGQSLTDAFDAASSIASTLANASVGDVEQLSLFGDAAASADQLAAGLTTAADAGQSAAQAAADVATAMGDAGSAGGELAAGADDAQEKVGFLAGLADRLRDAFSRIGDGQRDTNNETSKGVDLAGRLSAEFEKITGKASGLVGPMSRFTDEALKAVAGLEGVSGIAAGGLAAGAVGLLAAGASFKSASDTITLATGATGTALHGLQDDFAVALQGSGRSAGDLAQILGTLNRDTGITGQGLSSLTDETAKFLKVTNGSVGDVRGLTQAMLALGVGADGLAGFEDQLATVTTHFGISLSSLVQQIKTAGPALATFGFDPGQVAGLIGELDQAGLSVQRLVPGFTKLSQTASADGKTAAQALGELIDRIKGAGDSQAALNEVQGVFSGRVAAQFVNAVRNGTVDIAKLNAVMGEAPGTVDRLGASVKGLSAQFGGIRNDILAAFGQQGLPLLEGLRQGIEDIRPFIRELLTVLSDLAPVFKGFAEAAFLPVEALRLLGPPLELLDAVLSHIPGPVLEAIGALAAFKLLPFGLISQGLTAVGQGLIGLVNASEVAAASSGGGLTAAIGAINPIALTAAAGIAVLSVQIHKHQDEQKELKDRVDALNKSLGDLGLTAADAAPKIEELLAAGSKGKLIDNRDLDTLKAAGVSVDEFTRILQKAAADPSQDITKELRRSLVEGAGGIKNLIDSFDNLHNAGRAKEIASTAEGEKKLTDEFINQNSILGELDPHLRDVEKASKGVLQAEQDRAKGQLDTLQANKAITAADREQTASKLGLKNEAANEIAVRDALIGKLNEEKAAKAGLATGDATTDQRTGQTLDALEKEGALRDQVAAASQSQAQVINELAAASRNGIASDADRVRIVQELVAGGLSEEDAAKRVAKAEQDLANVQAAHTPITKEFGDALHNVFEQIGRGTPEWQALSGAAQTFGVDVTQLGPAFDALNSKLQAFAPPIKVGDDVMGQLIHDMQAGLPVQTTFKDLLEVSGGNADVAFAALDQYKKGVEDTTKALDGLVTPLGTVIGQLEDQAKLTANTGPDATEQAQAITAGAAARKAAIQSQIDDLKKLKEQTGGDQFDAQISDLEARQKDVDSGLARAQAALGTFDAAEKAIRANATLRDSDLAQQQAQLAAARDLAQQQAAANGQVFDPAPLNNKINDLQAQRDQLATISNQTVADAQAASGRVQQAVDDAQGGLLDFGAVLDVFNAQVTQKLNDSQIISELEAQGLGDIVKFLFDPTSNISEADRSARLNAIATLSPEERTAFEQRAKASLDAEAAAQKAQGDLGDIFAGPNPAAVEHANARGADLAKGIADGFIKSLDDAHINEIIDLVIQTGVDPAAARKAVTDKLNAAKAAANPAAPAQGLEGFGISVDQIAAAEQQLGGAGTTAGALYVQATEDAIRTTTIDPDAAAAMLQPVQDQLPIEGAAGGASVASTAAEAIKNSPVPPDAATVLVEGLRAGLTTEGTNGGADYAIAVHGGIGLYPVPTEAGTILVASVSQALTVAGTDAGANYALSVAAGIALKQGDAVEAAHLAAIRVDEAGHAGLEAASPSKKGIRLGGFWIDGIVQGITDNIGKVEAAAFAVGDAVSAPLPRPVLVGAGAPTGGSFSSTAAVQGAGGAVVNIENITVTGTTNASADELAAAMSRQIGWIGITGRAEA